MGLLVSFLRKKGGMPFFTFPHPTAWNVDMIGGVLSTILGHEDDGHTRGGAFAREKPSVAKKTQRLMIFFF